MKVDHVSDLHVNHYVPFTNNQLKWKKRTKKWASDLFSTGEGDVVVIAGDFSEWNRQSLWVLEEASLHYKHVFFGVGNHDYYLLTKRQKKKYRTSLQRVQELFDSASALPNVTPLNKSVVTYEGVTFAGDCLWYNLETEQDKRFYHNMSNDSLLIHTGVPFKESYEVLHPESLGWYKTLENENIDVFVSHVPPLHPPISPYPRNACYDTSVPFLVGKHWISGHQHVVGEFKKAGVQFHMNPLGYPSERHELRIASFEV